VGTVHINNFKTFENDQSKAEHMSMICLRSPTCAFSYARMPLTMTPWPWYLTLT